MLSAACKRRTTCYNVVDMKSKATVDLTRGNVWKILILYSLPLFGSAMVQQLYSLVDLLIVGNFATNGDLAVDAIGNATIIVNLLFAFALGANGGCSVVVARYFGAKDNKSLKETVFTSLIAYSVLCVILMMIGYVFCDTFLSLLNVKAEYYESCKAYLDIYLGSLIFVFLYNLGCGICSALGDSKTPFIFLIVSSVINITLDILFVCVWHMDVAGAAWATFISQTVCCVLTILVLIKKMRATDTTEKCSTFNKNILKELVSTSLPIVLQHVCVSVGSLFVNRKINSISIDATTGFTAAFRLVCMANMGVISMNNGFANFCSQNKGAGEFARIKLGHIVTITYTLLVSVTFAVILITLSEPLTRLFVNAEELTPQALAYSIRYLTIVSFFLPVVCVKIVCDGAVRGCGGNLGFAVSTFADLLLRVFFVYFLVDNGMGFDGVCWAWNIGWSVSMFIAIAFFMAIPCLKNVKRNV